MARPKRNNADYFSHDADMRNDPKIKALRNKFGLEGYAIWCLLLEMLTDSDFFELEWTEFSREIIAADFGVSTVETLQNTVYYLEKLRLVEIKDEKIYSQRLKERLQSVIDNRNKAKNHYENRVSTVENRQVNRVSTVEMTQSKVKESKVKESKGESNSAPDRQKVEFQSQETLNSFLVEKIFSEETKMNGVFKAYEISKIVFSKEHFEKLLFVFSAHQFKNAKTPNFSISELYSDVLIWISRQQQFERQNINQGQKNYQNGNNGNSSNKRGVKYTERINELIETVGSSKPNDETGSRFSIFDDDTEPDTT